MMTALIIYLSLSACATTAIVASVMVGARRGVVHGTAANEAQTANAPANGLAFSH